MKYGYEFGCIWIKSQVRHAPERVPIIYYRDKTRVQMFYFDSNDRTSPMCCISCLESLCWRDVIRLTVPWDPNKISSRHLLNCLDQWTFSDISSDARFNFYKDDFGVLKFLHHWKPFKCLNLSIDITRSCKF